MKMDRFQEQFFDREQFSELSFGNDSPYFTYAFDYIEDKHGIFFEPMFHTVTDKVAYSFALLDVKTADHLTDISEVFDKVLNNVYDDYFSEDWKGDILYDELIKTGRYFPTRYDMRVAALKAMIDIINKRKKI